MGEIGWTLKQTGEKDNTIYFAGVFSDPETGTSYDFEAGIYRCEGVNGCYDIVFTRSFEGATAVTLKMISDYNQKQIFGCAYLTADGKAGISLSHTIRAG